MRKLIILLLLLAPGVVQAQGSGVELTPFVGYRWGGEIRAEDIDLFAVDVKLDEGQAFGILVDFPVTPYLQVELALSQQSTEFIDDEGGLFSPSSSLADVDVSYYHVGGLFQWPGRRPVQPYMVITLGVTKIDPDLAFVSDESEFSAAIGGGAKLYFNRHLGMRFDLRFFVTNTGKDDWDWDDCEDDCWHGYYDEDLYQGQVSVGLHARF